MSRLSIAGLRKEFEKVRALKGIDLEVEEGTLVSLLGPSGCGKTTTLRCVAGFEQPSAGRIVFDGVDVAGLPPEKRDIGMVFQNYALFPHMTVAQNLAFGLEMRRVARPEREQRIAKVLEMVQLQGYDARYPRQLSGGQQQRVALARALVIEPKLLLLDEPLANLDAKLREEMRFFIRGVQRRVGITTMYVTHDQAEAMVMSDQIVVMFDGEIAQIGSAEDLYSRPASRQVASFIGLSNFIAGEVTAAYSDMTVVETSGGLMNCAPRGDVSVGQKIAVLVRPEVISLLSEEPEGNRFTARVAERYFLGDRIDYRLTGADGLAIQAQLPSDRIFAIGVQVWCAVPAARTWLVTT
jgi:putative spermidine/putrescine transport system ATP-binding protein